LENEFAQYGTITSVKIMKDDKYNSKGFGFVCFSSPDEATKAVTELNGKMIGTKPLYVSLAQRKDIRKSQLEAQAAQRTQLRTQQLAMASGIPGIANPMYPGAPMYYPPNAYAPQGGRGAMIGYPPQPMAMPRGRGGQLPGMPPIPPPYGAYPYGPVPPMPQGQQPPPPQQQGQGQRNGRTPRNQQQPQQQGNPRPQTNGVAKQPTGPSAAPNGTTVSPQGSKPVYQPKPSVRNPDQNITPTQSTVTSPPSQAPAVPVASPTTAILSQAPPGDHKQILGETLYPRIADLQPELAGKITGMLLEMDNSELIQLADDHGALNAKVREAMAVLEEYSKRAD